MAKQCCEKAKNWMKQDYNRIKDQTNHSESHCRAREWCELLDGIIYHRLNSAGNADTMHSAVGKLACSKESSFAAHSYEDPKSAFHTSQFIILPTQDDVSLSASLHHLTVPTGLWVHPEQKPPWMQTDIKPYRMQDACIRNAVLDFSKLARLLIRFALLHITVWKLHDKWPTCYNIFNTKYKKWHVKSLLLSHYWWQRKKTICFCCHTILKLFHCTN